MIPFKFDSIDKVKVPIFNTQNIGVFNKFKVIILFSKDVDKVEQFRPLLGLSIQGFFNTIHFSQTEHGSVAVERLGFEPPLAYGCDLEQDTHKQRSILRKQ